MSVTLLPPPPRLRTLCALLVGLIPLAAAATPTGRSEPADSAAAAADPDPILRALTERLAARPVDPLPPDRLARLTLQVLEVIPGRGTRQLGRFSAPIIFSRTALLERRVDLTAAAGSTPIALGLEVRLLPRLLSQERASFEVESRVRALEGGGPVLVRRSSEALEAGRSALMEAFQVPGTSRRLVLALSWNTLLAEPIIVASDSRPAAMVDLLVELVRVERGAETTLRRQRLSTGLGTEVQSLMRLAEKPQPGADSAQELEVRLAPRTLDRRGLLLGIQVKGALESDPDSSTIWIDHQDAPRLGPGGLYSVDLGKGEGAASYRLDIRPYY
jgi:hypothetical protein